MAKAAPAALAAEAPVARPEALPLQPVGPARHHNQAAAKALEYLVKQAQELGVQVVYLLVLLAIFLGKPSERLCGKWPGVAKLLSHEERTKAKQLFESCKKESDKAAGTVSTSRDHPVLPKLWRLALAGDDVRTCTELRKRLNAYDTGLPADVGWEDRLEKQDKYGKVPTLDRVPLGIMGRIFLGVLYHGFRGDLTSASHLFSQEHLALICRPLRRVRAGGAGGAAGGAAGGGAGGVSTGTLEVRGVVIV